MTTIRKVIGRLPMLIGEWQSNYREGQGYMKNNRVLIFNSELQSKIDNNTYVPATQNSETGVITFDTTHWIVVNDGRSTIGLDEKLAEKYVKPVGGIPTTDLAFTPVTLDSNGLVPAENLPSYVDDIVELLTMSSTAPATCAKGDHYFNTNTNKIVRATAANTWGTSAATNTTPEKGKIYYNLADEKIYRWSGTQMVLSGADLQIGTVTGTAADGGTVNDHINNTSNPHGVTKEQVGLGNVGNFKAVSTVANQGLSSTEQANARENIGAGTSSFSGSYNDLSNKPTIPAAQVQTDWNATSGMGVLLNKPSSLPASDVYSWAKESTKPAYKMSEVSDISVSAITSNTSSSCTITGSGNSGKMQTIIYTNSSGSDLTVTVPTTYSTPDGAAIELTCPNGGYCEVNYLNIGGTIYARGL